MRYLAIITLTTLLCTITPMAQAIENRYEISDLEILSKEKSYNEFFTHAHDIRPSKRDSTWKTMVGSLGLDYLEDLANKSQIDKSSMDLVYKLSNWPVFSNNEFFITKRDLLFLRQIKDCYSLAKKNQKYKCDKLAGYVYNDYKHELTFSYELVALVSKYTIDQSKLWYFSKKLVKNKLSEFYCSKPTLKKIILNEIYSDISKNNQLTLEIHQRCFKSLTKNLRANLVSSKSYQRDGAMKALVSAKALGIKDKSTYHIVKYLSEDQIDHNDLDLSIETLKVVGNDHKMRKALLKTINKLDPLPDNLFSAKAPKKNPTKTRILFRYFPEYIDTYVKTCLSYLNGTKSFPYGNPTPNCHNLFKMDVDLGILPQSFKVKYQKATPFLRPKI